jgi:hypothetical protein
MYQYVKTYGRRLNIILDILIMFIPLTNVPYWLCCILALCHTALIEGETMGQK